MRISADLRTWLKDYAKRNGTTMTYVIKTRLKALREEDERTQRRAQRKVREGR